MKLAHKFTLGGSILGNKDIDEINFSKNLKATYNNTYYLQTHSQL